MSEILSVSFSVGQSVVAPDQIVIHQVEGSTERMQFKVTDFRDEPLRIGRIVSSSPDVKARIKQEPTKFLPGWEYVIEVTVPDSQRPPGQHFESLALYTNDPERDPIVVGAVIHRLKRVRVTPLTLYLKRDETSPGFWQGAIFLEDRTGSALVIGSVRSSHPTLQCNLEATQSASQRIAVRMPDSSSVDQKTEIVVRISLVEPSAEEICVKVVPPG